MVVLGGGDDLNLAGLPLAVECVHGRIALEADGPTLDVATTLSRAEEVSATAERVSGDGLSLAVTDREQAEQHVVVLEAVPREVAAVDAVVGHLSVDVPAALLGRENAHKAFVDGSVAVVLEHRQRLLRLTAARVTLVVVDADEHAHEGHSLSTARLARVPRLDDELFTPLAEVEGVFGEAVLDLELFLQPRCEGLSGLLQRYVHLFCIALQSLGYVVGPVLGFAHFYASMFFFIFATKYST